MTEHRISSGFFLVAGREIEAALREETAAASWKYLLSDDFIASWEDGRVVLLNGMTASAGLRQLAAQTAARTRRKESALRTEALLKLLWRVARRISIEAGECYIEIPSDEVELAQFLRGEPGLMRDLGRALVGRPAAVHVLIVGRERKSASQWQARDVSPLHEQWMLIDALQSAGEFSQAQRLRELLRARQERRAGARPEPGVGPGRARPVVPTRDTSEQTKE